MIIFSRAAGQVVAFSDPASPASASIKLQDWGGFDTLKSLITRVGVSGQCNYQFLHTLGGDIFIYSFGDRIGRMVVAGLSFDNSCGDGGAGQLGVEQVIRYYNRNRLAVRRTPLKLTIGVATTLKGFLEAINVEAVDPVSRIWEFSMNIALVPDPIRKIAGGEGAGGGGAEEAAPAADENNSPGNFPSGQMMVATRDTGGQARGSVIAPVSVAGYATHGRGPGTTLVSGHTLV